MTGSRRMTAPDATTRAVYRHWTTEKIRFNDLDALGHLNNCAFAIFCESARVEVLAAARGMQLGGGSDIDWVIVNLNIDFRAQGHYPNTCDIGTRVLRIGTKSVTLGNGLFVGDTCIATATATVVLSDLKAGKALPMPDHIRSFMEDLMTAAPKTEADA
jgi:acyl-CoA thioester hydrolase